MATTPLKHQNHRLKNKPRPCSISAVRDGGASCRGAAACPATPPRCCARRTIHNGADRTLAPSSAAADDLVAHGVQRVWRWRRGVDSVRFDPAKRSPRLRCLLAPNGETIVGYVGRLAVEKRVDLLAATCRLPGVKVVVVGDGPAGKDLRRALPGALFLGVRHGDQLARIFASLDIFVHTGAHETFGQTVQEALASGVPVVAPAAGGPLDLVTPGVTGTLVPPGDAGAIADAVVALAADPIARKEYAEAARASVAGRGWAAVGDELLNHYVDARLRSRGAGASDAPPSLVAPVASLRRSLVQAAPALPRRSPESEGGA
jgi:phosphatidylinositol alpha 1,6-mannosyltransferase